MYKVLCFLCFLISNISLISQKASLDPFVLEQLSERKEISIIVKLNNQKTIDQPSKNWSKRRKARYMYDQLVNNAVHSQLQILEYLENQKIQYRSLVIVNAIVLKANKQLLDNLLKRMDVKHISGDPQTMIQYYIDLPTVNNRNIEPEWGIQMIQADSVWARGYTGQGVVVAGQDTGYDYEHPSLIKKYRGYRADGNHLHDYNWHDAIHEISVLHGDTILEASNNPCGLDIRIPCDDNNHGTHTMGTIVGSDEENATGVAPNAKWVACRNMERGYGSPSTYLECFDWFLAPTDLDGLNPDPLKAPSVIANSWSCPEMEGCNASNWGIMEQAVHNLRSAGILVVVSAGNSGSPCETVQTPAAIYEDSFTVGATDNSDHIAGFSSRGPVTVDSSFRLKPDISAPGVAVRSTIRNGNFASFSGTSMAGPHVAGVVALILSARPDLTGHVEVIEEIIKSTAVAKISDQDCAEYKGDEIPNAVYGYGRINALAAIEEAVRLSSVNGIYDSDFVEVFPNPCSDQIYFRKKDETVQKLVIVDGSGREYYRITEPFQEKEIQVYSWPSGYYHYQLWSEDEVYTGTILVQ